MNQKDRQIEKEAREVVEGGEADRRSQRHQDQGGKRTSDNTNSQVKYADNEGGGEQKQQGGSTRTTTLESVEKGHPENENATPRADPAKSRGELNEGRPHPAKDISAESQHREAPLQPLGPYNRDPPSGDNPEVDNITREDDAQKQREKRMEKAEGDR